MYNPQINLYIYLNYIFLHGFYSRTNFFLLSYEIPMKVKRNMEDFNFFYFPWVVFDI